MPPRRSTRAASAQPIPTPPTKAPASRTKPRSQVNGVNGKRSPSLDRPASPPAKRLRGDAKKSENEPPAAKPDSAGTRKPPSRGAAAKKAPEVTRKKKLSPLREVEPAPEAKPEPVQLKPYFNQLPTPPQAHRPSLLPFVWGAGNFGQFGLGPEVLHELPKPKRHVWIEKKIEEGIFGDVGAGIESVAAGGLHTVFIDEKGTVGLSSPTFT